MLELGTTIRSLLVASLCFTAAGVVAAQIAIPSTGSCTATYNSDGSANLVCTTSLLVPPAGLTPPPPVLVAITPSTVTMQAAATQQFSATVSGSTDQAVTWSATAGTISATGLFTAPSTAGVFNVTASSVVYPAASASAIIDVVLPNGQSQPPAFTGNWCTGTTGCTLNNVAAGDLLLIGAHGASSTSGPVAVVDSQGDAVAFDAMNIASTLYTWHIAPVVHAGTHTISAPGFNGDGIYVSEFSGIDGNTAIDAVAQNFFNTSSTDTVSLLTSNSNDLLYALGRASSMGTQQGPGFTPIRIAPTIEYAAAPNPGIQTVTIQPLADPSINVGIQAVALRPVGSNVPPLQTPKFTGNFCVVNGSSCTLNQVAAGDMLIISALWWGTPTDVCRVLDNVGETIVVDRQNDSAQSDWGSLDLATWHIASVVQPGTHTISAASGSGGCWQTPTLVVSEYSNQSASSPVDSVGFGMGTSGSTATASVLTSQGNDLIYAFCAMPPWGSTGTGDGFGSIAIIPTAEYRTAGASAGTETATCPVQTGGAIHGWAIQELAIKH